MYATTSGRILKVLVKKGEAVWPQKSLFNMTIQKRGTRLVSRDEGKVKAIYVKEGDYFKENDLLLEIDLSDGLKSLENNHENEVERKGKEILTKSAQNDEVEEGEIV